MKQLVASLIILTLLSASAPPVAAAGERIEVLLSQEDGTAAWDADDSAGNDSGPNNGIVRTNDNITYRAEVRVEDGSADEVTLLLVYPQGVESAGIPPFCQPGSALTPQTMPPPVTPVTTTSWTSLPQQTLSCIVGTRSPGSTLSYPFVGRVRAEVPQGTSLSPTSVLVTSLDVPDGVETNSVEATVSARPRFDLSKNSTSQIENGGYIGGHAIGACPSDPDKRCFNYLASVLISTTNGGKGVSPLASPIVFTDDLSVDALYGQPNGYPIASDPDWIAAGADALQKYGAELISCPRSSVYTTPGFGVNGTNLTTLNSVRDSGRFTCSQPGGPGTPVTISIADADTTAYTVPTQSSYPDGQLLPAGIGYVVSGRINFGVPVDAVLDLGVSSGPGTADLTWDNKFTGFEPVDPSGTSNDPEAQFPFNDHRRVTSSVRVRGTWSKTFIGEPGNPGNTPPSQFRPGWAVWEGPTNTTSFHSGDGILLPGQVVISGIQMNNQSSADVSSSFLICDNWDNTKLRLKPGNYPASTVARMQQIPSNGAGVWWSGYKDDTGYRSTLAQVPAPLNVEYGTGAFGNTETCEDADSPTGWHTDPTTVPGGVAAINKVRINASIPANTESLGVYATASIALEALGHNPVTGQPNSVGTILPNFASGKRVFGTLDTQELLDSSAAWKVGTYNPQDNTGTLGDRILMGAAAARLQKQVWDATAGDWAQGVPSYTANDNVDYRLRPSLTAGAATLATLPVTVEDCLAFGQSYVLGSASIAPTLVQFGSTADAELSCPDTQIYLRWDLGLLPVNEVIEPITYSAHVSAAAASATMTNLALIAAEGDPSLVERRLAEAQIQMVAPSGVAISKTAITPQSDINRTGEASLDPLKWLVGFRNLEHPGELSAVDIIDRLPANGLGGSSFNGTLAFDSATVVAGNNISILYTKTAPASLSLDANDPSNSGAGSTVWCDLASGGVVESGAGTADQCPAAPDEVTGLRFLRPGTFAPDDLLDVEVVLIPEGNRQDDVYVNETSGRAQGLLHPVGPVSTPEVIVASELGDIVWSDLNGDGVQDPSEPGVDGVTVSLWGIDDDGNPVGTASSPLTTVTSGGGAYRFDQLPAGTYSVVFDDDALADGEIWTSADSAGVDDAIDSDGDPRTGLVADVVLGTNERRLDVDQGLVRAEITVVKTVNTEDANVAPGPTVAVGGMVSFDYLISNPGALDLIDIELLDDVLGTISCPSTSLAAGQSMTCTIDATAVLGPYVNTATVDAQPVYVDGSLAGERLEATDPAHHFGGEAQISLVKYVNGEDANEAPGVLIGENEPVKFEYVVTNTGNLDLTDIALTDDILGPITCPETSLAVAASMTCSRDDVAVAGPYVNVASVIAQPVDRDHNPWGERVEDEDLANYFGGRHSMTLLKSVNGHDGNNGSVLVVDVGDELTFTYLVTNTGNTEISAIELTDDVLGPVKCARSSLAPGQSMECTFVTIAEPGTITNIGIATGTPTDPTCAVDSVSGCEPSVLSVEASDDVTYSAAPAEIAFTGSDTGKLAGLAATSIILGLLLLGGRRRLTHRV